jgi:glycerate-2-kinase
MIDIFYAALSAVDPYEAVKKALVVEDNRLFAGGAIYDLNQFERIIVVGAEKPVHAWRWQSRNPGRSA